MIRDTCKCGSAFQYESRANFSEDVHRQEMDALAKWLKAHDVCRQPVPQLATPSEESKCKTY